MTATLHRLPVDPDLELAMTELALIAVRMRDLEAYLVRHWDTEDYRAYGHRVHSLNEIRRAIATRAEQLQMRPGSLLLFIEEHAKLRERHGRKPSLAQLQRAVADALDVRKRDLHTRKAEQAMAEFHAKWSGYGVEDGEGAVSYLQACAS